ELAGPRLEVVLAQAAEVQPDLGERDLLLGREVRGGIGVRRRQAPGDVLDQGEELVGGDPQARPGQHSLPRHGPEHRVACACAFVRYLSPESPSNSTDRTRETTLRRRIGARAVGGPVPVTLGFLVTGRLVREPVDAQPNAMPVHRSRPELILWTVA